MKELSVLTPKNLYRLLTGRMYGELFPREKMAGITLIRFWREELLPILPGDIMERFFPEDGSHPRAQSNLMNRTGTAPMPLVLQEAMDAYLSPGHLMDLVVFHEDLLGRLCCRGEAFAHALTLFEEACFKKDVFIPQTLRQRLVAHRGWAPEDRSAYDAALFRNAYRLSWLVLMALYGPCMHADALTHLCLQPEARPGALWQRRHSPDKGKTWEVLTENGNLTQVPPLPQGIYVQPFPPGFLEARLKQSRKVLIHGMGGCGKTEFVRQTLSRWAGREIYQRVAVVVYDHTLQESLLRAFGDAAGTCSTCLDRVRELLDPGKGATLLVLDNADTISAGEGAYLASLPCDCLVTGRIASLEGFDAVAVPPLDRAQAEELFAQIRHARDEDGGEGMDAVWRFTGGHPLTLVLLAQIARANYWSAGELARRLAAQGLEGMTWVHGGSEIRLRETLRQLFDFSVLKEGERRLMQLLAILPTRPFRPDELIAVAMDLPGEGSGLPVWLQALAEGEWLERGTEGYLLSPVIAEAVRARMGDAEGFPRLWKTWGGGMLRHVSTESLPMAELALSALLRSPETPGRDAVQVMCDLEMTAMTRSANLLYPEIPQMHRQWLDTHEHTESDEVTWHIARMLWALLGSPGADFAASAAFLGQAGEETLLHSPYYDVLCNVLEVGGDRLEHAALDRLFERIEPPPEDTGRLIQYLNFLGGKQRSVDRQLEKAMGTLTRARQLIDSCGLQGSVEEAANDTRMAYCLADRGQWTQTLPLMRRVLDNLRARGYAEDSQTMESTKNTYLFFRGKCTERQVAMDDLTVSLSAMRADGREKTEEYCNALKNLAALQMDDGQDALAEATIRQCLDMAEGGAGITRSVRINAWLMAGRILMRTGKLMEALGYVTRAEMMNEAWHGGEDPDRGRFRAVRDEIMEKLGDGRP